jgi:hypothetical protein
MACTEAQASGQENIVDPADEDWPGGPAGKRLKIIVTSTDGEVYDAWELGVPWLDSGGSPRSDMDDPDQFPAQARAALVLLADLIRAGVE